jgi:hypothetical protein
MSARANALRLQVETALAGRVASPFEYRDQRIVETVPAGVLEIDRLTGGLPRGALTEICGPPASGRTSVLVAAMAARTEAAEVCALVDARDAFDPESAAEAGVRLGQLLWVRCRNVDQALRATYLLIQGGGFGLMALEQEPNAKTCASLVLRLGAREARWTQTSEDSRRIWLPHTERCLFEGERNYAEVIRSRTRRVGDRIRWREETSEGTEFQTRAMFHSARGIAGRRDAEGGAEKQ